MDADDPLRRLWQDQPLPAIPPDRLRERLQRHRFALRLRRCTEALLTAVAVLWFGVSALRGFTPADWLLLPYFSVFLVVAWTVNLRRDRAVRDVAESGRVYATLRLAQLRAWLCELMLTRRCAEALVAYALCTFIGTRLWAAADWHWPATTLLSIALVWWAGSALYVRHRRRLCLREYRALRRLHGP